MQVSYVSILPVVDKFDSFPVLAQNDTSQVLSNHAREAQHYDQCISASLGNPDSNKEADLETINGVDVHHPHDLLWKSSFELLFQQLHLHLHHQ